MKLLYKIAVSIFKGVFRIFICLEVNGKENIPPMGPVMVVSNHLHLADPPLLILCLLPRKSRFMAKEDLFQSPFFGFLMRLAEAFPVKRTGTIKEREITLLNAVNVLREGSILGMFPEGGRSPQAQLIRGYPGMALIAVRSGAPILPVAITGTEKLRGKGWVQRPKVTIYFGRPFNLPVTEDKVNKSQLRALTDLIMTKIAVLLPPEYRGEYGRNLESGD